MNLLLKGTYMKKSCFRECWRKFWKVVTNDICCCKNWCKTIRTKWPGDCIIKKLWEVSSNINEVIKAVLNLFFFFFNDKILKKQKKKKKKQRENSRQDKQNLRQNKNNSRKIKKNLTQNKTHCKIKKS